MRRTAFLCWLQFEARLTQLSSVFICFLLLLSIYFDRIVTNNLESYWIQICNSIQSYLVAQRSLHLCYLIWFKISCARSNYFAICLFNSVRSYNWQKVKLIGNGSERGVQCLTYTYLGKFGPGKKPPRKWLTSSPSSFLSSSVFINGVIERWRACECVPV